MRILIYSYNYYPEPIGIAPLMTELAEGLVNRGHNVRVITAVPWYPAGTIDPEYRGKLYLTEERNGVKIQRCYVWSKKQRTLRNRVLFELSFVILSFFQSLKGWRPEVILLTVPGLPVCVPAAILGWLHRTPVILNLQDILPDAAVHVGLIKNKLIISIFKLLEKFAYLVATKITVIADGFTQNLLKKGVPAEKITEIDNWVDVDFITSLPQDDNNYFRQENQLQGKFIILYSGNIALTQPVETLIDAARRLQHIPDIAVVIVGNEKGLERLERYRNLKQVNNTLLLPFQPRKKLPEMLAAANITMVMQKENVISFNMPSKIQVLLASGRPIIASVPAKGTAARAIERSGGGIVVPPENPDALAKAILDLYNNREKSGILELRGRKYAEENYAIGIALDAYEKLFELVTQ